MEFAKNEKGALLAASLVLLFIVSLFLFTVVSWHSNLYRTFDSFESYYKNETTKLMRQGGIDNEESLLDRFYGER
ncbi:hypothetical protein MHZ92_13455 [Sporosarcina sp. ACRSL]|uniref:hypothetical protein n=1 Tax=Sporosarcina sp. ACRSL TaxID=2918215 RepID=UPI001EF5C181|nr:hypothetical protein [Sporosarcina sp. ACRSL]MCG7345147.1 hypothetical protein [Sporosarcina sp. ACRSL]